MSGFVGDGLLPQKFQVGVRPVPRRTAPGCAGDVDSKGRLAYLCASNPKGQNNGVELQKTYYVYGDAVSAARPTKVVYPDTQDTVSGDNANDGYIISVSGSDHVSITYDRLGRKATVTDQRGVVHAYSYDSSGRFLADAVTSLGTSGNVDNTVLRIQQAYDDVGRVQSVTSYDAATSTTTLQVRPMTHA